MAGLDSPLTAHGYELCILFFSPGSFPVWMFSSSNFSSSLMCVCFWMVNWVLGMSDSHPATHPDWLEAEVWCWMIIEYYKPLNSSTYDHRSVRTGHPVRSAIHKHWTGRLVLEWVTIWESRLLYVFVLLFIAAYTAVLSKGQDVMAEGGCWGEMLIWTLHEFRILSALGTECYKFYVSLSGFFLKSFTDVSCVSREGRC